MSPILERVQEFLTAHELNAHPHGDGEALVVPMTLTHCRCSVVFHHEPGADELVVMAMHSSVVPPERRAAVAEFFTRLNWNLTGNRFLLDWQDGEVRLRRDVDVLAVPNTDQIGGWFYSACLLVDGFFPALMNVVYRGMNPAQALEQGEADYQKLVARED